MFLLLELVHGSSLGVPLLGGFGRDSALRCPRRVQRRNVNLRCRGLQESRPLCAGGDTAARFPYQDRLKAELRTLKTEPFLFILTGMVEAPCRAVPFGTGPRRLVAEWRQCEVRRAAPALGSGPPDLARRLGQESPLFELARKTPPFCQTIIASAVPDFF